jgi:hypothetical protein
MVVMFGLVLPLVHHRPFRWCVRRGSLIWRYGTDWYLPARLECVDALPRNGTGKVRKELLRGFCQSKVSDWCPRGLPQDLLVPVIGPCPVVISACKLTMRLPSTLRARRSINTFVAAEGS